LKKSGDKEIIIFSGMLGLILWKKNFLAQLKTWSWISGKQKSTNFSYPDWCFNNLFCLKSIEKNKDYIKHME